MRTLILPFLSLLISTVSFASYDSSWNKTDFWSREYPRGVSVVKRNLTVIGRTAMDRDLKPAVKCALPYKAVIHPWNDKRNRLSKIQYASATKIVPMIAKEDFTYDLGDGVKTVIQKGDVVEFMNNFSEGSFAARHNGVEFSAGQDLYAHLEDVDSALFVEDDWFRIRCENGKVAWIALDEVENAAGFGDWGPGLDGYGKAHDLP